MADGGWVQPALAADLVLVLALYGVQLGQFGEGSEGDAGHGDE